MAEFHHQLHAFQTINILPKPKLFKSFINTIHIAIIAFYFINDHFLFWPFSWLLASETNFGLHVLFFCLFMTLDFLNLVPRHNIALLILSQLAKSEIDFDICWGSARTWQFSESLHCRNWVFHLWLPKFLLFKFEMPHVAGISPTSPSLTFRLLCLLHFMLSTSKF